MADLDIIKEIEKLLQIKLTSKNKPDLRVKEYFLNANDYVISLNLYNCNVQNHLQVFTYLNQLSQLLKLDLGNNSILDLNLLTELQSLTKLDLGHNQITDIAPLIQLTNLTELDLGHNQITDITPLMKLPNLIELNLRHNQITDIAPLAELRNLTNLDLTYNKLSDIDQLKGLTQLTQIFLSENEFIDLTPLQGLKKLKKLTIDGSMPSSEKQNFQKKYGPISNISALKYLTSLIDLSLNFNQISDISPLEGLTNLQSLSIYDNKITDISPLKGLKNLKELYIKKNQITDISPLSYLTKLNLLLVYNNKITDISPLKNNLSLKTLGLNDNLIEDLPEWISEFHLEIDVKNIWQSGFITLNGNPIKNPPIEIIKQGKKAIKRFFNKIKQEGIDNIYEAKLIFVGEGSSGKTSLKRRLINEKAALPRRDKRTRGIEIKDWQFKKEKARKHIAHIWDFGGQDVYYPVHRFFITENSVFVVLASTRQTHHNFDYWIPTIYQFGGKSPIILGQTCHGGNKVSWNDLGVYIGNPNFNITKTQALPYYELDLPSNNEGLKKIKQVIINQITGLPHYGKGVPKSWVSVKNILSNDSKKTACLPFEKFIEICRTSHPKSFSKLTDITDCCQFLHDIGIVLWYSANEELKNWVILQPEWAMNAVYRIIDDEEIQKRKGNILARDFNRLWQDIPYEDKHLILKKMLETFKIAFPKKHKQQDYIIPARLPSMPNEKKWQDNELYLRLEYRYEFMPRGLVNQVSAELSRYIVTENEVWNNAVNFCSDNNTAECQMEEDFYNRKIMIKARGKDARSLIMLTMDSLKNITDGYKGVRPEIYVPCTCSKCINSNKPSTFLYDKLLVWSIQRENAKVICNESSESLFIDDLLYSVGLSNPLKEELKKMKLKTVTIFLASSSELKKDREQFEIFINRENKRLNKDGVFIDLEMWEDFIDAMSKTRLQDEYNKVIRASDIFISLFFTKVGQFTAEEFDAAFGKFKESNKPIIYTYFKDGQINLSQIKKTDINSKHEFEEKLKSLGHFPTIYKNIEDLKYQFKMQLEKILPTL